MKNWKKVTAGILTVMMAASLAACGGTKEAKTIAGKENMKGAVIGVQLGTTGDLEASKEEVRCKRSTAFQ